MKKEIQVSPPLDPIQQQKADMHSFLNAINSLYIELEKLAENIGQPNATSKGQEFCVNMVLAMGDPEECNQFLQHLEHYLNQIFSEIDYIIKHFGKPPEIDLINVIINIIRIRVHEYLSREDHWVNISKVEFIGKLKEFLEATVKASRNRFGVVYSPAEQTECDYLVDIQIESENGELVSPQVLHDCVRDLIANARKYSQPGSKIQLMIKDLDGEGLLVKVSDEGRGIPPEEIELVACFGYRGSNTNLRETRGGGIGLTKAYKVAKDNRGKLFIDSEIGRGTTVEMLLYNPGR